MDLHHVPGKQPTEIAERQPPEARGAQGPGQGPFDGGPGAIHHSVGASRGCGGCSLLFAGRRCTRPIGQQPQVLWAPLEQQGKRAQGNERKAAQGNAGAAPAGGLDQLLQQRQQEDRPQPHTREGDARRQAAPALKPGRQEERLTGVAQTHAACAHQHPEGEIEVPGLRGQRGQNQPPARDHDADERHPAWATRIHEPAKRWAQKSRDQKAERKGAGRHAAIPAELLQDGRKEEREGRACIDAHRHGDEHHRHHDPSIEKRQSGSEAGEHVSAWDRERRAERRRRG